MHACGGVCVCVCVCAHVYTIGVRAGIPQETLADREGSIPALPSRCRAELPPAHSPLGSPRETTGGNKGGRQHISPSQGNTGPPLLHCNCSTNDLDQGVAVTKFRYDVTVTLLPTAHHTFTTAVQHLAKYFEVL